MGPEPVPAGARLTVNVDSRLVSGIELVNQSDYGRAKVTRKDAQRTLSWDLRRPLAAGVFANAFLHFSINDNDSEISDFEAPMVFAAPARRSTGQRITGGESVQRHDSAHDSASVATYGG